MLEALKHDAARLFARYGKSAWYYHLQSRRRGDAGNYSLASTEKLGCLFYHIPKCAGLSVVEALFGGVAPGHLTDSDYRIAYSYQDYCKLYRFTFVRNPWDRAASAYHYLIRGGTTPGDEVFRDETLCQYDDFNHFLTDWLNPQSALTCNHFKPQTFFLPQQDQHPPIDFVGRFERLAEDFTTVIDHLGVSRTLPHANQSSRRNDYQAEYGEEARRRVEQVYAEDIERFAYRFEG